MRKFGSIKLILFFTALTLVLTWLVIFGYESYLRAPFYSWVEARYPGDRQLQDQIEQRVEHFCISTTVDVIVVTLLLGLVNRQQRKLRASEERYRALFEHAGHGIGVVTALEHKLVDANKKFGEILAYNQQAILGTHICDLMGGDDDGPRHGFLSKVLACDVEAEPELESHVWSDEVELSVSTGTGSHVTVSASCSKLSTGQQQFLILMIQDLTERKRLEIERQEIERQLFQQSKLASIGELSAGVAHEINNPLNCIVNFAQLLKDDGVARNEIDRQMVDGIIEEGYRIARIVRDLLNFARQDPNLATPIAIVQVIRDSLSLFGRQLERDGITLEIEADSDLLRVRADASRLRQVVVNMISNAHHALKTKPGGERLFRITARNVEQPGERIVRIEFYDNGPGVPRENIDKIFDPFFTTRRDRGGTGLGLSLSFGIIRDCGGRIWVESELGSYTRFVVELPADVSREAEYAESLGGGRRAKHTLDDGGVA
jgi:PAS domain S-box-containing protein